MTTIKQQIISAISTKLADILTTNGYSTNMGSTVGIVDPQIDPNDAPAVVIWHDPEESTHEYGNTVNTLPVRLEGFSVFGSTNASTVASQMSGDLIECIAGSRWTIPFTSGGTYEPQAGDTLTGATSTSTAIIQSTSISSGAWADGDAEGTFTIRRKVGDFTAENFNIGANLNIATTTGVATYSSAITTTTNDLADEIMYAGGGVSEWPEAGDLVVGVQAVFNIKYSHIAGDPYHQR